MSRDRCIALAVLLFPFLLLSPGCGYRPVGVAGEGERPALAIPTFENHSQEPVIEAALTELVREEFINDGRFRLVSERGAAYLLRGSIQSYGVDPLAFDPADNVREARLNVAVAVVLEDLRGGREPTSFDLWARSEYLLTGFLAGDEAARADAERRAFAELAEELSELVVSSFLFP